MPGSAAKALALAGFLAASTPLTAGTLLRHSAGATDVAAGGLPYDPVEVLCAIGPAGKKKVQTWCKDWLDCIRRKSAPEGTAKSVRSAWMPANCKEVCGVWPATSKKEGQLLQLMLQYGPGSRNNSDSASCRTSCKNYQVGLSECVAKILFEPGQVAVMGIPDQSGKATPKPDPICTDKKTDCKPELPIDFQRCIAKEKNPAKDCKLLKKTMEDCKDCPQLKSDHMTQYNAFVGGCMSQLHAYWQATHPDAKGFAIAGAGGCQVHPPK